jgi:prepilin-type N-terminal cleavage/methylation domain-containing protein
MKKLNKKGFTLIELLVVVAIIAILAGIVLVSLNSARERSEKASLQSTMASIMPVISMCVNDGGTVNATTETQICSVDDITEPWPVLPTDLQDKHYDYELIGQTSIVGFKTDDGTTNRVDLVECTFATGSCQNPTE